MATNDRDPRSVMSRGKGDGHVVNGGRMVKHHRWTSMANHRETWPENPDEAIVPARPAARRQRKTRTLVQKLEKPHVKSMFTSEEQKTLEDPESTYEDIHQLNAKRQAVEAEASAAMSARMNNRITNYPGILAGGVGASAC